MNLFKKLLIVSMSSTLALAACAEDRVQTNKAQSAILATSSTGQINNSLIPSKKEGRWGYTNTAGKMVIPYKYDAVSDFSEGLAVVVHNDMYGAIDTTGKTVVPFKYDHLDNFSDGLALFTKDGNGLIGFVDSKGYEAIEPIWDMGLGFSEGLAAVGVTFDGGYKWGFIDTTGKVVIKLQYDAVYIEDGGESPQISGGYFKDGLVKVYRIEEQIKTITINKLGDEISLD